MDTWLEDYIKWEVINPDEVLLKIEPEASATNDDDEDIK